MNLKSILSSFAVLLAISACQAPLNIQNPVLQTAQGIYDVPTEGSVFTVSFTANQDWEIVVSPANSSSNTEGVTVRPMSGKGSKQPVYVTVKMSANNALKRTVLLSIMGQATSAAIRLVQPGAEDPVEVYGTLALPYSPSGLCQQILAGDIPAGDVYVRGVASKIVEISPKLEDGSGFGNATFFMTDDGVHPEADKEAFEVYRSKGFNLQDVKDADIVKEGDVVTILSPVMLYAKSEQCETVQYKSSIVAVNGLGEVTGEGSQDSPFTVAKAMDVISGLASDASSEEVYVKGIFSKYVDFYPPNGNYTYYITDDGYHPSDDATVLYIFRSKYFGGANYTSAEQLKLGDEVVVRGTLKNYGGTMPEMNTGGKLVLLNGNTE